MENEALTTQTLLLKKKKLSFSLRGRESDLLLGKCPERDPATPEYRRQAFKNTLGANRVSPNGFYSQSEAHTRAGVISTQGIVFMPRGIPPPPLSAG